MERRVRRLPLVLPRARLRGSSADRPACLLPSRSCIILELFSKKIPFPGTDEINQLDRIYDLCGTPLERDWPDLTELPWYELLKRTDAPLPSRLDAVYARCVPSRRSSPDWLAR